MWVTLHPSLPLPSPPSSQQVLIEKVLRARCRARQCEWWTRWALFLTSRSVYSAVSYLSWCTRFQASTGCVQPPAWAVRLGLQEGAESKLRPSWVWSNDGSLNGAHSRSGTVQVLGAFRGRWTFSLWTTELEVLKWDRSWGGGLGTGGRARVRVGGVALWRLWILVGWPGQEQGLQWADWARLGAPGSCKASSTHSMAN